jgi:hypothetical protein
MRETYHFKWSLPVEFRHNDSGKWLPSSLGGFLDSHPIADTTALDAALLEQREFQGTWLGQRFTVRQRAEPNVLVTLSAKHWGWVLSAVRDHCRKPDLSDEQRQIGKEIDRKISEAIHKAA